MAGVNTIRLAPRQPLASVSELTILVRVPGDPAVCRAYTATEAEEAAQYAAEQGGEIVALPVANDARGWPARQMRSTENRPQVHGTDGCDG